ncbi:MAG: hypothetical protein HOQ09_04460, partial [Gemmatimonadaceae bacterium]|nr:hypothetical protein [Gemmatimonadaceae bacterium]
MSGDRTTTSRRASASSSASDASRLPELRVELGKRADGRYLLRCTRRDGSASWQLHDQPNARFFPLHDLTHFAVETTLEIGAGFFGLVADGWDIADTGGKGARGAIPREAVLVEHLVGLFDRERDGTVPRWTAPEFNEQLALRAEDARFPLPPPWDDARLDVVRARVGELH